MTCWASSNSWTTVSWRMKVQEFCWKSCSISKWGPGFSWRYLVITTIYNFYFAKKDIMTPSVKRNTGIQGSRTVTYLAFVWVAFRGLGTRGTPRWWRDHLDSPLSASQIGKSKAELTWPDMTPLKTNILLMEEIRLYRPGIDGNLEVFMGTFFKLPAGWSGQKSGQHGVWHENPPLDITDSTKFWQQDFVSQR